MKQFRKKMAVIVVIALVITALIPVGAFAATTVPTIQTQPSAASAAIGSPATFTVALDESGGPAAAACTFPVSYTHLAQMQRAIRQGCQAQSSPA